MSFVYDYALEEGIDNRADRIFGWVGQGSRVLELGTAAGIVSRELQRRGCRVTGIEYVPEMAREAERWCERMIVGDLETLDLAEVLGEARFDVILAADVLEHLRDPFALLARLPGWLAEGGRLVLSVPNVGHAGVIAGLLEGRFEYRDTGLLDRTHLRFFTRHSLDEALQRSGWLPLQWDVNRVAPDDSELRGEWRALQPQLRQAIASAPDHDVYQFLVLAAPAGEAATLARQSLQLAEQAQRLQSLAREHERILADLLEHQKAFAEARELIARRDAEIARQEAAARQQSQDLAAARAQAARLDDELQQLRHHYRWTAMLRRLFRRDSKN